MLGEKYKLIITINFTKNTYNLQQLFNNFAAVVKLADALDSKSCGSDTVPVRLRPAAPTKKGCNRIPLLLRANLGGVDKKGYPQKYR